MTPLEAVALVALMALPLHWLVQRELAKAGNVDPRSCGIVVVRESAIDAHSLPIGEYMGHEVWQSVTFRGLVYQFDRIQSPSLREKLGPGELFLDPGLVYALRVTA